MNDTLRKKKVHRSCQRRSASAQVKVTCQKSGTDPGPNLTTAALDLSQTGARLLVTAPLEVGQEVVLGLEAPGYSHPLTRRGRVVWAIRITSCRYAVGVRLQDPLGGDDIQQITIHPVRLDY